jgi:hypothetical protein
MSSPHIASLVEPVDAGLGDQPRDLSQETLLIAWPTDATNHHKFPDLR